MSIILLDRIGVSGEARGGASTLGQFIVRNCAPSGMFMNSFPVNDGAFLVPEAGGRWELLQSSQRVNGTFQRAQMLDPLDASSIRTVGRSVSEVIEKDGTWLDIIDMSPLVPGMSSRAEIQPFEQRIEENCGHLEEVCRRPRAHLRVEIECMPVSLARRFPAQAPNYLAAHTEDWERPTLRSVIPKKILANVREDQVDIYENRVAVRLVDHLVRHLQRRVLEVSRLLRIFEEAAGNHSSAAGGTHWRQKRIFKLWGAALDAGEAKRKAERTLAQLKRLLYTISGLMDSLLYREVPRRATVSTTLTMTNILSDDVHYRRVADLWIEWAKLGLEQTVRPREYFDGMQDLCRSFDLFALLVTLSALHQLGFEPTEIDHALSAGETEVRRGCCTVRVSWTSPDGAIVVRGPEIGTLRMVPLCSSLTMLDADQLRSLIADADAHAPAALTTTILYPAPSEAGAYECQPPDLTRRLRSLAHEVAYPVELRRVGFLPVSPWDIGSVERMARLLRWITTAPSFLAYPPKIECPVPELIGAKPWVADAGNGVRIARVPPADEVKWAESLVEGAANRLQRLNAEHEELQRVRNAVKGRSATGHINAQKKELNEKIKDAATELTALKAFTSDLSKATEALNDLRTCPTCSARADAWRDFQPDGQRFTCSCPGCSTKWGTGTCGRCSKCIPFLMIKDKGWIEHASTAGWVDRTLGADVLAIPWVDGAEVRFKCPSCGDPVK